MIANAGHDENGKYHGGKAGDQTGSEYCVRSWYNRPWSGVLRAKKANVREVIADVGEKGAKNNNVGYDQYQRLTLHTENAKVGWHPEKITTKCETDCTASAMDAAVAAGHRCGVKALTTIPTSTYSGNIVKNFKATGEFEWLTDSKYRTSDKYLLRGDILVYENHHAAINLTNGSAVSSSSSKPSSSKKGYSGTFPALPSRGYYQIGDGYKTLTNYTTQIKRLQSFLNWAVNAKLTADGDYGPKTSAAVKLFQKVVGLKADGLFGKNSLAKAKSYRK